MAEKSQKQKLNNKNESIYLFDNKNGLLFFTYDSGHPKRIDIDQFNIGKFRLFRKDKVYSAELKTKPFLNPSLIWNAETFELMIKKLNDFALEEDNIDLSEWLFVSVYVKIKGQLINLLKIKVNEEFGIEPQNQLWNEFKKYNTFKSKSLCQTAKQVQTLSQDIEKSLTQLEKTQNDQQQKVDEVKKKLSAIMHQKQKKIMELTGNHLYKWTNEEELGLNDVRNKFNFSLEPSQGNWMSSQDDRMLVGSLFAPSQDFEI